MADEIKTKVEKVLQSNGWISNIELAHQIHKPISKVDKILEDLKKEEFVDARPAR